MQRDGENLASRLGGIGRCYDRDVKRGPLRSVTVVDGLLPQSLARELRSQVVAMARLQKKPLRWFDYREKPRILFEQIILALRPHVPGADGCVGAEWWSRVQGSETNFKFHFDTDLAIVGDLVTPERSSVLYLSESGGPTVIVDIGPRSGRPPNLGLEVHPCTGRFLTFPGELLHGVLPGSSSRWPRVAMFINWWAHRPKAPGDGVSSSVRRVSPLERRNVTCRAQERAREKPFLVLPATLLN